MKAETWHLNLKFSVADTDAILAAARRHVSADEIAERLTNAGLPCSRQEVVKVCFDSGTFVRERARA